MRLAPGRVSSTSATCSAGEVVAAFATQDGIVPSAVGVLRHHRMAAASVLALLAELVPGECTQQRGVTCDNVDAAARPVIVAAGAVPLLVGSLARGDVVYLQEYAANALRWLACEPGEARGASHVLLRRVTWAYSCEDADSRIWSDGRVGAAAQSHGHHDADGRG